MSELSKCIGLIYKTQKTQWWSRGDYTDGVNWSEYCLRLNVSAYAECVEVYKDDRSEWLVMRAITGEAKGAFTWTYLESLSLLHPLEQLAIVAKCDISD